MQYKVSVIIPVYSAEKYIERCARSLFEQTLKEIEFVFVNDCTPDRSMNILQELISKYPNRASDIIIINLPDNQGSAIARYEAIKHCHGEYITQCDSDDWLELIAYETMYNKAKQKNADVVITDYYITDGKIKTLWNNKHSNDRNTWINDMLYLRTSWSVWNKLIRHTIYDRIQVYPKYSMGEDSVMMLQMAYYCTRVSYTDYPLYYYYQNPNSIVNSPSTKSQLRKFREAVSNSQIILEFYQNKPDYKIFAHGLNYFCYHAKSLILPLIENKKYRLLWRSTFPMAERKIISDLNSPCKDRIKSLLSIIWLYPWLTKQLGITKCI